MSNKIGVYDKSYENATLIKFKYSLQPAHPSIWNKHHAGKKYE